MSPQRHGARGPGRAPRSAALSAARRTFALHARAERLGMPVDELAGAEASARARAGAEDAGATRRELLLAAGAGAGALALTASPAVALARRLARSPAPPRVAIVGGGLAGLRCAHALARQNPRRPIAASVYEANPDRAGGRCWTLRNFFEASLTTEHGGAFINSNQHAIRRLVAQLGLEEELVNGGDLLSGEEVYLIGGSPYSYREANRDWADVGYPAFRGALRELRTPAGERRLDAMSVPEWLASTAIGTSSRFGQLMIANAVTENGGDPDDMSALDLVEVTGHNRRSSLSPIPGDDERYHVVGGNDQIVARMIAELPAGAVQHDRELVALRANTDRSTRLVFRTSAGTREVDADLVVLALPFSKLRTVDLRRSGLSALKRRVIDTFGMGANAKIHVELSHKTWPALGYSGATYSDWEGFCCAWDDSVALGADASPALLLGFPGGRVGRSGLSGGAHGPAPSADVDWLLTQIEQLYPGTRAAYDGLAYEDHWALDPWVQGAYSYCRVGQASSFGEIAAATEGGIHFAGEHTSIVNQGFLDGAVETGERAAREILRRLA
ncbi:MAG TPA: NAD(P)/FAD-dependent oxidoreductase [Solirubrobacteraceae bacterium]